MAIFDRLFGRRKKEQEQVPAPQPQQSPAPQDPVPSAPVPQAPAQNAPGQSTPAQSAPEAPARPVPSQDEPVPQVREIDGGEDAQTQERAPRRASASAPAQTPTVQAPTVQTPPVPAPAAEEQPQERTGFFGRRRSAASAPAPQPEPVQQAPVPQAAPAQQPIPTQQPGAVSADPDHLDGWLPSQNLGQALEAFRSSRAGHFKTRARMELARHLIGQELSVVLGPGGDGKPTLKAHVNNSKRILSVFTDAAAAEDFKRFGPQSKNGLLAQIPGEVLFAWVLSQPKVHGICVDPVTTEDPAQQPVLVLDFDREDISAALEDLVNPGLRAVVLAGGTPQQGLVALREEDRGALVVRRRTPEGLEPMLLRGERGETILPVFTSAVEVQAMGTSLEHAQASIEALRALVPELGADAVRVNPAGPHLDLPANSL